MSTRKRSAFSNPSTSPKSDLPPSRKGKATAQHKTTPPFSSIRLNTFVYILSSLALAFIAFNVWRMLQLKTAAGGWWNLALGKRPHGAGDSAGAREYNSENGMRGNGERDSVEDRINSLAEALGLPSHELASAIAEAVKNYVPPASLSSISDAEATHSGTAVRILVGDDDEKQPETGMGDILSAFAGFDDPVMD